MVKREENWKLCSCFVENKTKFDIEYMQIAVSVFV